MAARKKEPTPTFSKLKNLNTFPILKRKERKPIYNQRMWPEPAANQQIPQAKGAKCPPRRPLGARRVVGDRPRRAAAAGDGSRGRAAGSGNDGAPGPRADRSPFRGSPGQARAPCASESGG